MPAEVKTRITAEYLANAAFDAARKGIDGLNTAAKESVTGLKSFTVGFQDISAALGFVNQALQLAQQGYQQTVSRAMSYDAEIRNLSRAIGVNAQEASKLNYVAKAVGLSYDDLQKASNKALAQGVIPSIDGLEQLAEKYKSLPNPIDRAKMAAQLFGVEGGPKMASLLSKGAAGISELETAAVKLGVLLDEKTIASSKRYSEQLSRLQFQAEMLGVAVGNKVVPMLEWYATAANSVGKAQEYVTQKFGGMVGLSPTMVGFYALQIANAEKHKNALLDEAKAAETAEKALVHKYAAGKNPNSPGQAGPNLYQNPIVQSSNWGNQTVTVNSTGKLDITVKVDQQGSALSVMDLIRPALFKVVREMQMSGLLK